MGLAVVEGDIAPAIRRVTTHAVGAKLSIMFISGFMAANAILRRTFKVAIGVALRATCGGVSASQGKRCLAVVKGNLAPTLGGVAAHAVTA